jgi:hypothetical protein
MEFKFDNTEEILSWLKNTKLIKRQRHCNQCGKDMRWAKKKANQDSWIWNCGKCDRSCSIREGLCFFSKSSELQNPQNLIYSVRCADFPE